MGVFQLGLQVVIKEAAEWYVTAPYLPSDPLLTGPTSILHKPLDQQDHLKTSISNLTHTLYM